MRKEERENANQLMKEEGREEKKQGGREENE